MNKRIDISKTPFASITITSLETGADFIARSRLFQTVSASIRS
jgi:hypothetical protein